MKRRYLFVVLGIVLTVVVAILLRPNLLPARGIQGAPSAHEKPTVKFNHKFHITEASLECAACHPAAEKSNNASDNLHPAHEQCQSCHGDQLTSTCGYCHLNPDSIEPRVVPVHEVVFSHEKHLAMKGVQCSTCHAGIAEDSTSAQTSLPTMDACTTCHNDVKAAGWC